MSVCAALNRNVKLFTDCNSTWLAVAISHRCFSCPKVHGSMRHSLSFCDATVFLLNDIRNTSQTSGIGVSPQIIVYKKKAICKFIKL